MSYQNYNLLSDEEINTILPMSGKQAFGYMKQFKGGKLKQLAAIWLNERNIKGNWEKYK